MPKKNQTNGSKLLKTYLAILAALNLTACAQIGNMYDRNDPCQTSQALGRPAGYTAPNWCGSSGGRQTIYNNQGIPQGYIKRQTVESDDLGV